MITADRLDRYYQVIALKEADGDVYLLVKFDLPSVNNIERKRILEGVLERSSAEALIELFWTKGSIIHKNKRHFYAILVFGDK